MMILKRKTKNNIINIINLCRWVHPAGTLLLFWPTVWGLILGARGWPSGPSLLWCGLGCLFMRSAGCIYNDWVDRDFDRQVRRTAQRPLACGSISVRQACVVLGVLLCLSALILCVLPRMAVFMSLSSLPLIALYPWLKRWTFWPQVFLGLTFNWGMWVGYVMETSTPAWFVLPWYMFGVIWTIIYDTIYAHQDKGDDRKIGVKSTALRLGAQTKPVLYGLLGIMLVCVCLGQGDIVLWPACGCALIMTLGMGISIYQVSLDHPEACGIWFKKNTWWGAWIAVGLLLSFI